MPGLVGDGINGGTGGSPSRIGYGGRGMCNNGILLRYKSGGHIRELVIDAEAGRQ